MNFEVITVDKIQMIASGRGIRDRRRLNRTYGNGRWRKMKGWATIRFENGIIDHEIEVHWYEASGLGKVEYKIKRPNNE